METTPPTFKMTEQSRRKHIYTHTLHKLPTKDQVVLNIKFRRTSTHVNSVDHLHVFCAHPTWFQSYAPGKKIPRRTHAKIFFFHVTRAGKCKHKPSCRPDSNSPRRLRHKQKILKLGCFLKQIHLVGKFLNFLIFLRVQGILRFSRSKKTTNRITLPVFGRTGRNHGLN